MRIYGSEDDFGELVTTVLSTAIGSFSECPEWNRFTAGNIAACSNNDERPDHGAVVLSETGKGT
jgi:hypothetical protein